MRFNRFMAKFLLTIFLMAFGFKIIANVPALSMVLKSKSALYLEDFKESEEKKDKREKSESDPEYSLGLLHSDNLSLVREPQLRNSFYQNIKPHSGFPCQTFTPPNF